LPLFDPVICAVSAVLFNFPVPAHAATGFREGATLVPFPEEWYGILLLVFQLPLPPAVPAGSCMGFLGLSVNNG
jgi:hypothetical protein